MIRPVSSLPVQNTNQPEHGVNPKHRSNIYYDYALDAEITNNSSQSTSQHEAPRAFSGRTITG